MDNHNFTHIQELEGADLLIIAKGSTSNVLGGAQSYNGTTATNVILLVDEVFLKFSTLNVFPYVRSMILPVVGNFKDHIHTYYKYVRTKFVCPDMSDYVRTIKQCYMESHKTL